MLKRLNNIAKKVLFFEKKKGAFSILLTDDRHIRQLNKKYRKIDRATDVLSFCFEEKGHLGDIAISTDTAKRNSKRYKAPLADEFKRLVIHGTLHLLGYDHVEKSDRIKMRAKEDKYAEKIS